MVFQIAKLSDSTFLSVQFFVRVRRFSQFGLNLKWYTQAKIDHSNWKIAMRNSGKPVSSNNLAQLKTSLWKTFPSGAKS